MIWTHSVVLKLFMLLFMLTIMRAPNLNCKELNKKILHVSLTKYGRLKPMDASNFSAKAPGTLVPIAGQPDARVAFVPHALPPAWRWPEGLYRLLIEARIALAALDGTGKHLPDSTILIHPLQAREAQLSSRLEGTITDPHQQILFQADPAQPTSPVDAPYREVYNYRRALRLRLDGTNQLPLSLRLIRQLHALLLDGVRSADPHPGEFRTIQNQIDRPARFVPAPPESLPEILAEFESFLHDSTINFDPLVKSFLAHYQFETIHPFRDGNGRVGRLLLALTIAEWCSLSGQWLYMSPYFEKNRSRYIDLLFGVSTGADWESWIQFCLEGVVAQSLDAQTRCDRLLALHRDFHARLAKLKRGSIRLSKLIDGFFEKPVISVGHHQREGRISYPTARADLQKLEKIGILQELSGMDYITYYCREIYDITYDDVV